MKVEFDKTLWARVQAHARAVGYSSAEEFVQHAVEREMGKTENSEESVARIRGIGYIDAGLDI